jgi:hypothetical protein
LVLDELEQLFVFGYSCLRLRWVVGWWPLHRGLFLLLVSGGHAPLRLRLRHMRHRTVQRWRHSDLMHRLPDWQIL